MLTLRNFTGGTVSYKFRWDETFEWKTYELDSQNQRTHIVSNGCGEIMRSPEIEFDHSYEDGYQERSYSLEHTDQPETPDPDKMPPGTIYNFETLGNGIDLYRG